MKKIISAIFGIIFLGIISCNAQKVNVDLIIKFNGTIKTDSVYLFFYPTTNVELGQRLPLPDKKLVIHELKSTFQIYPGAYTLGVLAFGSKPLNTRIYIPPIENFQMELILIPLIIGWGGITSIPQINEVTLRGDFNAFEKNGEIPMSKNGDVWKLEKKPQVLEEGKKYTFYVNGEETTDLLNPKVLAFSDWLVLKNVYLNNELVFDPLLYSLVYKESELKVQDTLQQLQFKQLVNEINLLEKEKNEIFKKATSREAALPLFDTLISKYSAIENKYPKDISQLIIEKELGLIAIKCILLDAPQGNQNDTEFKEKLKEYYLGEEFEIYFTKINELINKLDPGSFLLNGEFTQSLKMMQDVLNEYPDLAEKFNLSENYFDEFFDNFIKNSPDKKLCYSMLFTKALMFRSKDEAKTAAILDELKSNSQYTEFINNEQIERLLGELNIKPGKIAPNFSVDLLNGKKLSLSDFSGKFVFIDFWGSWCAPCRQEIPNIKKLYSSVSRDKLEIIGLAQDDEKNLRNYIEEQKIEYPNALAPKELLAKYGISRYPTSFLINPKGKIVRMDIRGADIMELIREEIEDYYN
jgi:peroxiredoxin